LLLLLLLFFLNHQLESEPEMKRTVLCTFSSSLLFAHPASLEQCA
jgi:hypothetical protein